MDLSSPRGSLRFMKDFEKRACSWETIERFFDPSQRSELSLSDWTTTLELFQASQEWENVAFACLLYIHAFGINITRFAKRNIADMAVSKMEYFLQHPEPRVRSTAAKLVGSVTLTLGPYVFVSLSRIIHECVHRNESREVLTRPVILGKETELALDEVTGWRALESSYTAFKELIYGMRMYINVAASDEQDISDMYDEYVPLPAGWSVECRIAPLTQTDIKLFVTGAALHVNRYVRQAGCELVQVMCSQRFSAIPITPAPPPPGSQTAPATCTTFPQPSSAVPAKPTTESATPSTELISGVCQLLAVGLQDSWCQVRLAATEAVRKFVVALGTSQNTFPALEESVIWPLLLPRLCLNRHYSTDSVRENAHRAWREGVGNRGLDLLTTHMDATVRFYLAMSRHKNHMVCEAACSAMAELASKANPIVVNPHLPAMLLCLRDSLADSSWPVRDSGCTASGRFLRSVWKRLRYDLEISPRIVPIPSAEEIIGLHTAAPLLSEEISSEQGSGECVSVLKLCKESIDMLFSFLNEDPFRPVRDSAAVAIVDALLPPLILPPFPSSSADSEGIIPTQDMRKGGELHDKVVDRIAEAMQRFLLSAHEESNDTDGRSIEDRTEDKPQSQSLSTTTKTTLNPKKKGGNKTKPFAFIPPAMLADMESHAKAVQSGEEQGSGTGKGSGKNGAGIAWGGGKRRTKGRVGGGWGCCLDCGPGEDRVVVEWEKSEAYVLVLREIARAIKECLCRGDTELEGRLRDILSVNLPAIWRLLEVSNVTDVHKLHTTIYQVMPDMLECVDAVEAKTLLAKYREIVHRDEVATDDSNSLIHSQLKRAAAKEFREKVLFIFDHDDVVDNDDTKSYFR